MEQTISENNLISGPAMVSRFLHTMILMGEALLDCGAEVYRVEDTLNRIGQAYGAEDVNVFAITSSLVLTIRFPGQFQETQSRRLRKTAGNDLTQLENLNALSRQICEHPVSVPEFEKMLAAICGSRINDRRWLAGNILGASAFCIFFGGTAGDAVVAGIMGIVIWMLQKYLVPLCLNSVAFQFTASFLSGLAISLLTVYFPIFHMDKILIGDIMLLIPGLMFTNAIRDILLGDTISGIMRLIEALLSAAVLALGFMAAFWLVRGVLS